MTEPWQDVSCVWDVKTVAYKAIRARPSGHQGKATLPERARPASQSLTPWKQAVWRGMEPCRPGKTAHQVAAEQEGELLPHAPLPLPSLVRPVAATPEQPCPQLKVSGSSGTSSPRPRRVSAPPGSTRGRLRALPASPGCRASPRTRPAVCWRKEERTGQSEQAKRRVKGENKCKACGQRGETAAMGRATGGSVQAPACRERGWGHGAGWTGFMPRSGGPSTALPSCRAFGGGSAQGVQPGPALLSAGPGSRVPPRPRRCAVQPDPWPRAPLTSRLVLPPSRTRLASHLRAALCVSRLQPSPF